MLTKRLSVSVCLLLALAFAAPTQAANITVYDNMTTAATAGSSDLAANAPIFGDSLTLAQAGKLATVGFSLFNSSSGGNTGAIMAGTMELKFYDNTTAYAGGALTQPLLGTVSFNLDMTGSGGLAAGYYTTFGSADLSGLNIDLPQNILVTQQFTMTAGTSLRNGFIMFSDPTIGSSPNTVYRKSAAINEGLYTFTNNPGQVGYTIAVTPEPATLLLAGLGVATALRRRRR